MFHKLHFIGFILLATVASLKGESLLPDPFAELVSTVTENDSVSYEPLPEILSEIIFDFYAEETVGNEVPLDVLSYITDAYSEHAYNETGSWAPESDYRNYRVYKGKLPEYEVTDFRLPVIGRLTSGFGYRPRFGRVHRGVDIALQTGDTVRCVLPGAVVATGYDRRGYGSYVVVRHAGDLETVYAHLSCGLVRSGQEIKAGQPVGLGGSSGRSTGPHLHFETRYFGVAVDPLNWFNWGE